MHISKKLLYQEKNLPAKIDDDLRVNTNQEHGDTAGYLIWLSSLEEIEAKRTVRNNPKGDIEILTSAGVAKLAEFIKERYYIYSSFDLADLNNIKFSQCILTTLSSAKKIISNNNKTWYITTGEITGTAKKFFGSQGIQYLENTSKSDIINYLRSR